MKKTGKLILSSALVVWLVLRMCDAPAQAVELLINGNLESSAAPQGWSLATFVTGIPNSTIPEVVEHIDGGNNPGGDGLGLLLHPMKGNQGLFEDQDERANLVLEQTYGTALQPATPGRTYTFRGDVFLQAGYSGIINPPTLNPLYPKADYNSDTVANAQDYVIWRTHLGEETALPQEGPGITQESVTEEDYTYWATKFGNDGRPAGVASPTVTKFSITFLNAADGELGTTEYDLRSNTATEVWRTTDQVQALAPPNTQKVRVRVSLLDMVDNCCDPGQDVKLDNFKLSDNIVPGANRLINGNLNVPGAPAGWTITEGPSGTSQTESGGVGPVQTANSVDFIAFANRLSNTPNPNPTPPYATLPTGKNGMWLRPYVNKTQFNPDLPEVFGSAAQEVAGTPGTEYTFSAWSAWESGYLAAQTFMKIEFLNGASVIDSETLDLAAAGQVADASNAIIGPGNENGGNVEFNDWRQFSLSRVAPLNTTNVRVSVGFTGGFFNDLDNLQSGYFDEMSLIATAGSGNTAAVPEPGSLLLVTMVAALAAGMRRRGTRSTAKQETHP